MYGIEKGTVRDGIILKGIGRAEKRVIEHMKEWSSIWDRDPRKRKTGVS